MNCKLQNGQSSPGCNEENKPAAAKACNIRPCPTWMVGSWGKVRNSFNKSCYFSVKYCIVIDDNFSFRVLHPQCSVTCGLGVKQRSVECSDKDFSCDTRTKPQTTAPCNLEPCPQWTSGPWREVYKMNQLLSNI